MKSRHFRSNSVYLPENYSSRLKDCCRLTPAPRARPPLCTHDRKIHPDLNKSMPVAFQQHHPNFPNNPQQPQTIKQEFQAMAAPQNVKQPLTVQEKLFKLLNKQNRAFFDEKRKVCCKKRPPRERFNFGPGVPYQSIYGSDFTGKQGIPNPKMELPLQETYHIPHQKDSQYRAEYPPHPLPQKFKKQPEKALPNHPFIGNTSYQEFHNGAKGASADLVPPFDNYDYIPDLPFNGKSIYGKDFGPKRAQRAKSFKEPPSRLRNKIKIPLRTTYGENFVPKGWGKSVLMGPMDVTLPFPKGEFETEYKTQYPDKFGNTLNKCHYKYVGEEEVMG